MTIDACSKALQEINHGISNFVRINREFLFMGKIKAVNVQQQKQQISITRERMY